MDKKIKQMIKQLNDGKDLEVNLPLFIDALNNSYHKAACYKMVLNYTILYEMAAEWKNADPIVQDTVNELNHYIFAVFTAKYEGPDYEKLLYDLDEERNKIIEKMEVLTSYTDQLQIYEYVLNRKEPKYYPDLIKPEEDQSFIQKVLAFIFSTKDNVIINENIKEVIGQLPVRMARTKYFELIKNSLSLYSGQDKSSLDTYLYMLRTTAMLYEPSGKDKYHIEFQEVINQLRYADFDVMEKKEYDRLTDLIKNTAEKIEKITEYYLLIQEVINPLYAYFLSIPYFMEKGEDLSQCLTLLKDLNTMFSQNVHPQDNTAWDSRMEFLEGKQEEVTNQMQRLEAYLPEINTVYGPLAQSMMLGRRLHVLNRISKLLSTSSFVPLEEKEMETADEEYIEKKTEELMEELISSFKQHKRSINRAVMANTLNKLPVFFKTYNEVAEYITHSLEQCKDEQEKQISKNLIETMIDEENMFANR